MGLLSTVLQTLSMRDAMTARHSAAVARYSREVAGMLGLDEREQDLIHTAALLHDIGKFILPDSVLFADRKLTADEWELIKLHPEQGAKIVERIEGYGPVAEIVLHHHERYAGGGYPAGIGGEEIPLGSRILSVADTYDVMTSRDSYRRPVSSEAALAELHRVAGTQLDPKVVEAFERWSSRSAWPSATPTRPTSNTSWRSSAASSTTRDPGSPPPRLSSIQEWAVAVNENERLKGARSRCDSGRLGLDLPGHVVLLVSLVPPGKAVSEVKLNRP